jgi:hypothetical protein
MKKRTRNQLDDDDFRETMSRSSSPRDQILFPREGRIFSSSSTYSGSFFLVCKIRTQTQKKKAIGGKITKRRLFYDI